MLDRLASANGGARVLQECRGGKEWPNRGIYFFFEPGEHRSGSNCQGRVVRIGTHALKEGARSTLWGRLSQHKGGSRSGLGNHRGSIFRLIVGVALSRHNEIELPTSWGVGSSWGDAARRFGKSPADVKESEAALEGLVSQYICQMPFLWLEVPDLPGPDNRRRLIEQSAIALLSSFSQPATDGPSPQWLGHFSDRERVRLSGLWNNNHVDEAWIPGFLDEMESLIQAASSG